LETSFCRRRLYRATRRSCAKSNENDEQLSGILPATGKRMFQPRRNNYPLGSAEHA